ncbi:MAG TPA: FAD-dependent oxidoreductase [Azospirillum sp.]|nr:FAD-dependent oxidoreductase [Azospirillum sp.]
MLHTRYLVVGASHAGLEAVTAIRHWDAEGSLTMLTREPHRPYSPTILPYVVSGRSKPERVALKDEAWFAARKVDLRRGEELVSIDTANAVVRTASGNAWTYERLLLATGAAPAVPPVEGLKDVRFHVLRTLDDALALRDAGAGVKTAVVLGAGLVGLHAAEVLSKAGIRVVVVERQAHALPGYLDAPAAEIVETAFRDRGIFLLFGRTVASVQDRDGNPVAVTLDDGEMLPAELLLIGTGVRPVMDYLAGSGIETQQGILVDDTMGTSVPNVWAAGDVAQARAFFGAARVINGILPDAVEQGRIAGMAMAGDPSLKPYVGGLPINTFPFFGRHAVSVGISGEGDPAAEIHRRVDAKAGLYSRIAIKDGRLIGVCTVGMPIDAGVMWQLISRRVDLEPVKEAFVTAPLDTGRTLMSRLWR